MNEDRLSTARADIEKRVAEFRAKQADLKREREGYYQTVIRRVKATDWNEFATPPAERKIAR